MGSPVGAASLRSIPWAAGPGAPAATPYVGSTHHPLAPHDLSSPRLGLAPAEPENSCGLEKKSKIGVFLLRVNETGRRRGGSGSGAAPGSRCSTFLPEHSGEDFI